MKTVYEYLSFVFGWNRKTYLIATDVVAAGGTTLAGALLAFLGYVKAGVAENFDYLLLITSLVVLDFATGVWVAARQNKFETRKAAKLATKLISYVLIFVLARLCVRVEPVLLVWLPQAVVIPMVLFTFASLLKNLSLLGILPAFLAARLYKHIDAYKNPKPPLDKEPETP